MRRVLFVTLLLALVAAGTWSYVNLRTGTPSGPDPRGTHRVRVVGPDGELLAGVEVEMHGRTRFRVASELMGRGRTGEDGTVALPEPPSDGADVVYLVRGARVAPEVTTLDPTDATLYLTPATEVAGIVLDLRGSPIAGARVTCPPLPPHAAETVTDAQGRFSLGMLPENVWVRAERAGFAPLDLALSLYPSSERDFVFYLVRGRKLAGRVVTSSGDAVPDALVVLDQEAKSYCVTGEEGRFRFDSVLTDWEAMLTAHKPGLVGPTLSFLVGVKSAIVPLYEPGEIRGFVVDGRTGDPVSGATFHRIDATEGERGAFIAPGLLPGDHAFQVRAAWRVGEVELDVREGEVRTGIRVPLLSPRWGAPRDHRPAYPLTLNFVIEETGAPAEGVRVRGAHPRQLTRTDEDGGLVLRLPPGRHELVVGGPLDRHSRKVVVVDVPAMEEVDVAVRPNRKGRLVLAGGSARTGSKAWLRSGEEVVEYRLKGTELSFTADPMLPLAAYVKAKEFLPAVVQRHDLAASDVVTVPLDAGLSIRGRCLGAGGHPLAKVVAEVQEQDADARRETLGDGVIHLAGMEPGRYRLLLYARNVRTKVFDLDLDEEGVDLGDVQMAAPCDVVVRVLTTAGEPVAGAMVETSMLVAAKGLTDGAGRVRLPGTNEEETLRVEAPGFLDSWTDIRIPPGMDRLETVVTLLKPARLLVRTVDRSGLPLVPVVPDGATAAGPGELLFTDLPPGPFEVEVKDHDGRTGTLVVSLGEGEERLEMLVLE